MGKERKIEIEVCHGSHCLENKAKKVRKRLKELVEEDESLPKVSVRKCGCLKKCGDAPVVEVNGGKLRFEGVKPKHASKILEAACKAADRIKCDAIE